MQQSAERSAEIALQAAVSSAVCVCVDAYATLNVASDYYCTLGVFSQPDPLSQSVAKAGNNQETQHVKTDMMDSKGFLVPAQEQYMTRLVKRFIETPRH